jgi:hypothetical protein
MKTTNESFFIATCRFANTAVCKPDADVFGKRASKFFSALNGIYIALSKFVEGTLSQQRIIANEMSAFEAGVSFGP